MFQRWRGLVKERGRDGTIWRCGGRACRRSKISIRTESWFGDAAPVKATGLPLTTHLQALYQFSLGASQKVATEAISVGKESTIEAEWYVVFQSPGL